MENGTLSTTPESALADTQAEIARIKSILTCENAVGREAAAIELAFDAETKFSTASASRMLARLPKASAASPIPPLSERSRGAEFGSSSGEEPRASAMAQHFKNLSTAEENPDA